MTNIVVQNHSVPDIERMARAFSASKLFGIQTIEQAIALCLIAQAEGRHPASAAQDYHIIQGRPAKKADAMLRDFLSSGGKVQWHRLDDEMADASFSHPIGGTVRITWDMARAKTAQLATSMWSKYPRQMLRSRVVSEGVRTVYPMATSGMYVPEEVQEFNDAKPAINHQREEQKTIEGKASSIIDEDVDQDREVYERLLKAVRALDTVEKFDKFWANKNTIKAVDDLPDDLKRDILLERSDKAAELEERQNRADDDEFPGNM